MKNLPVISIVVPSYNQGNFIEETLTSILGQNYPALELIVMDGGSTDETVNIIRRYEKKLAYWTSEKDRGQSHAINKGLEKATGEIFNWINSDDKLLPGSLQEIGEMALAQPAKKLFLGRTRLFRGNETVHLSGRIVFDDTETTIGFGQVNQPGMFYRTPVLRETNGVDEQFRMCMDLDLWMKFLLLHGAGAVAETQNFWAAFRLHEESKTVTSQPAFDAEKKLIYRNLFDSMNVAVDENILPPPARVITYPPAQVNAKKCYNYFLLWQADALSLDGKFEEAQKIFRQVRFVALRNSEKRRYLAVGKRLMLKN